MIKSKIKTLPNPAFTPNPNLNLNIQNPPGRCLSGVVVTDESKHWCESLYEERAPQILLYGRSLGLSHSEAEDVLQETFIALMQQASSPEKPLHYCLRSFRNRALNYRR